MRLSNSLTNQ